MKQFYPILLHNRKNTVTGFRIIVLFVLMFAGLHSNAQTSDRTSNDQGKIVKLYPNPASNIIYFEFDNVEKGASFQICNFMGKKVYELQNVTNKNTVDLTNFYRGVYIFQLRDRNGKIIESRKFQIIK